MSLSSFFMAIYHCSDIIQANGGCVMDRLITVYHGSKQIVEVPIFGLGRKNNDFGLGFYCTESINLAKEWAVSSLSDGFANRYTVDSEYLNILNLNSSDYTILN